MAFKFERLKVWQKAVALSDMVNQMVKEFPADERYVLTSQIKRAQIPYRSILQKDQLVKPTLNKRNLSVTPSARIWK